MPTIVSITFDSNGQIQCSPYTADVESGSHCVIWNLDIPGATFSPNGIYLKESFPGTPVQSSSTQFYLVDTNTNTTGEPVEYAYGVNFEYKGNPYNLDPEISNDPGGEGATKLRYKSS